jgi:transcriptional regulator with XRE-family HTH domain
MLGDWIKREREARDWTLAELGERVGTSGAYIQHLEAGRRKDPRGDILEGLARAFGVSIEQIRKEIRTPPDIFPAEQLRREGLPELEITRYQRFWRLYPDKRSAFLESAQDMARAYAKQEQLISQLHDDPGDTQQIDPASNPIAN